jgi:UDP-glucose 4-epimerase
VYEDNPIPEHAFVHATMADASKMREATGWEPEIDFEEGLRRVCAPYQEETTSRDRLRE